MPFPHSCMSLPPAHLNLTVYCLSLVRRYTGAPLSSVCCYLLPSGLCCIQDNPEAAQKMSAKAALILEKQSQRRIGLKSANEFVRSSQAQQEERRQRLRKQAQKYAKKLAATQKTDKPRPKSYQRKSKRQARPNMTQPQSPQVEAQI